MIRAPYEQITILRRVFDWIERGGLYESKNCSISESKWYGEMTILARVGHQWQISFLERQLSTECQNRQGRQNECHSSFHNSSVLIIHHIVRTHVSNMILQKSGFTLALTNTPISLSRLYTIKTDCCSTGLDQRETTMNGHLKPLMRSLVPI
ncbi:hypothetical protein TNCV_4066731 [Trichonephila clavipes]|uniref:Uncharacterized protein n=1 Tax=Trichonephila clavipes TaxID=2585209 RepID=A0A8X7BGL8_TRICX|nr:hypothetical protein TNCV_4066731 [Trichonephila clavipes]